MASLESPLNKAHQHASNAEEYLRKGLLIPAAEERNLAAELFLSCVETAKDDHTKRTLRLLHNENLKVANEHLKKIEQLRKEGKDPSLPQASPNPHPRPPQPTLSKPQSLQSSHDSQTFIDESFMMLGQRSDPSASFMHFWKNIEGMLDNLSQPVAFATAPLHSTNPFSHAKPNVSSGSDTDPDYNIRPGFGRPSSGWPQNNAVGLTGLNDRPRPSGTNIPKEQKGQNTSEDADPDGELLQLDSDDDASSVGSFYMIPSASKGKGQQEKARTRSSSLEAENTALKSDLEVAQKRLVDMERVLKARIAQEQLLRDGIMMARREAQRALSSSQLNTGSPGALRPGQQSTLDLSSLNINVPSPTSGPPGKPNREAQLTNRVRELEEEVRVLKVESVSQKAMIAKYREKWDKIKESARRKKLAKATAEQQAQAAQDRIQEEIEPDL
ncbi:hypothetical protein SISNIDRAFT_480543 [Sistotremastrum niveocremeum HHB9708]|uniref:Uncharacterized protein n=1 Tax=Sistotremastrum niveocremeum HHB9708 TaxID=1314777 RepID=A0A165AGB5_9AGAM|nr:hypothetical protein SISNIDRAFT_480543 [Sistotremastrum niveocremeum HHB9708]